MIFGKEKSRRMYKHSGFLAIPPIGQNCGLKTMMSVAIVGRRCVIYRRRIVGRIIHWRRRCDIYWVYWGRTDHRIYPNRPTALIDWNGYASGQPPKKHRNQKYFYQSRHGERPPSFLFILMFHFTPKMAVCQDRRETIRNRPILRQNPLFHKKDKKCQLTQLCPSDILVYYDAFSPRTIEKPN